MWLDDICSLARIVPQLDQSPEPVARMFIHVIKQWIELCKNALRLAPFLLQIFHCHFLPRMIVATAFPIGVEP